MSDNPGLDIRLSNYPPSSNSITLRQLVLGAAGPMTLLVQVSEDEDTGDAVVEITLSNAAEHEDAAAFLGDMIELLSTIAGNPNLGESLQAAIEEQEADQ